MIYSCFNQSAGLYDYFQDDKTLPVNGDLPIPKHPPMAGKIGVPAIHAGRPLPSGTKPAGRGWHARGLVVQCGNGGGLGAVDFSSPGVIATVAIVGGAMLVAWYMVRR